MVLQRKFKGALIISKETELRNCYRQAKKNALYPLETTDLIISLLRSKMSGYIDVPEEKQLLMDFIVKVETAVIEFLQIVLLDPEL